MNYRLKHFIIFTGTLGSGKTTLMYKYYLRYMRYINRKYHFNKYVYPYLLEI